MSVGGAPHRRAGPGLWVGLLLIVLAVLATLVLRMPLGASEASALSWLSRFADSAGIGIEAFQRAFRAAWEAGQPAFSLALAGWLAQIVPALDVLIAARIPDALAAVALTVLVYRIAGYGEAGFAAGLWVFLAAAVGIGWVAPPGVVVDQGAAVLILAAYRAHAMGRSRGLAWLGLAIGLGVLATNNAGIYALAVVAGSWLHGGLAGRDWRLLGSDRLIALGALIVAGLTLTPALGLPHPAPLAALYRQFAGMIRYDGVPSLLLGCLAAWIVPVIAALVATLTRFKETVGRYALILAFGLLVLATTGSAPPVAAACLTPFVALWLIAPVLPATGSRQARPRWIVGLYGVIFLGQALVLAVWSLTTEKGLAETPLTWAITAAVFVVAIASVTAFVRPRLQTAPGAVLPIALSLIALAIALIGGFDQPRRVAPQRLFDQSLAADMQSVSGHPIAVLAPVDTALWRAELGRPLFAAADIDALCQWAADKTRQPIVLVRASRTADVLDRFPAARRELQSPGTPVSSVMVIRLGRISKQACRHVRAGKVE